MPKSEKNVELVQELLIELLGILDEGNGVDGFENAKSIYNTMTSGGGGFAEYFIWNSDETKRINLNRRLDEIRDKLWDEFKR